MRFDMSVMIKNGRVITATDDYVADVFIDGEVRKERAHCFGIQFARMAFAVKKNESLDR